MRAYVGADWSATEVVCAVADDVGEPRMVRGGARPTLSSVRELVERARMMVGADEVFVMIEAGAPQWASLFHAAGAVVHIADPKQARRFAESQQSSGAKDDPRDARSLTEMCRSDGHRRAPWKPDTVEMQQLDAVAKLHEQVTKDMGRVKQRLRAALRAHMPLVDAALPELDAKWVATLLRKVPTPWHARKLGRSAFDRLLAGAREATRERVWDALQHSEAPWLDGPVATMIAAEVRVHLDQLALLGRQLADIEKRLDAVTKGMASRERAESMDGIALMMSAAIIQFAFRDGIPANRDEASIRMGASPVFIGSAKRTKGRRKGEPKGKVVMRRAANSRARRSAYLIGRLASLHLPWARAMYAHAMACRQEAATAYRRIARCVLRIQTAMARTGENYDEAKYVAALKARGVPWAAAL